MIAVLLLSGCTALAPRTSGGSASINAPVPATATSVISPTGLPAGTITQSENPSTSSEQNLTAEKEVETTFPVESQVVTETVKPDGGKVIVTETFPAGTVRKEKLKQAAVQKLGAAQKDTTGEIIAKMSALKWLQYVGVVLLLGAAAMFHPVVRVAVGAGKSMQVAVGAAGLICMFGPALVVGNELLIGGLVLVGLGFWWFQSRLAFKEGAHDTLKASLSAPPNSP